MTLDSSWDSISGFRPKFDKFETCLEIKEKRGKNQKRLVNTLTRGAQKLTGENLEVVMAEFSTLS
jgi:hypothetical protein